MPDKQPLELTTQGSAAVENTQAKFLKRLRTFFADIRKGGAQMRAKRVLFGHELNLAKKALPHGDFEDVVEKEFKLPKSTQHRWREFSKLFLEEMEKITQSKSPTVGLLKKVDAKSVDLILDIYSRILDGRGEVEFMRDCKLLAAPKPDGGFRPNAEMLETWLKENHPELSGKGYDELPPDVQKAFREQYKPTQITDEEIRAGHREKFARLAADLIAETDEENHTAYGPEEVAEFRQVVDKLHDAYKKAVAYCTKLEQKAKQ